MRKFILNFWIFFSISIFIIFIIFFFAYKGWLGNLPSTEDIENPSMEVGSEIYDIKGELLGKFFYENRVLVTYNQLPKYLVNALLSKEDIRFKKHSGIDGRSLLRAIFSLGYKGGGSTISQQLAKLLFTGISSKNKIQRLYQKLLEWVLSVELERRYTKEEIISMYFNKFDFLYNAKGIETASRTYFNKSTYQLNISECATLVGMLENPSLYNPKIRPKNAQKQRNLVLSQMRKYHFIDNFIYKKILKKPINIKFKLPKQDFGLSTYYAEFLRKEVKKALYEYKKKTGKSFNIYASGLKIYTTIDSRMQNYAEAAVKKHLSYLQRIFDASQLKNKTAPFYGITLKKREKIFISSMRRTKLYQILKQKRKSELEIIKEFKKRKLFKVFSWNGDRNMITSAWDIIKYKKSIMQTGLLSIEPSTGYIKAWVGGVDFNHFQYDHVYKTKRQVGSIFKPFVYVTAIEKLNYNPCTRISNEKFISGNWSPRNVDGKYGGYLTVKDAFAKSVNTVSARLISITTPKSVILLAKKMGVKSAIPENLSISLGSADLTLYELTGAFNTFTNYGIYIEPSLLLKIEDKHGKTIKEHIPCSHEVFSEKVAYIMLKLMKGVVDYGTGKRIRNYGILGEVAGKTGTTNDHSDGWFVGLVPNLTTTVWVGWEDRFAHFQKLSLGQGANMALPIWSYYMSSIYKDKKLEYEQYEKFNNPENFSWENCESDNKKNIIDDDDKKDQSLIKKENIQLFFDQKINKNNNINYDD